MKKMIKIISMISLIFIFCNSILVVKALDNSDKNYISTKIVSVSEKGINIKFTNSSSKDNNFDFSISLKKKTSNGWKTVPFKQEVKFPKTLYTLKSQESCNVEILWKDYYENNLSEGVYKLIFVKPIVFEICEKENAENLQNASSPKTGDIVE